MKNDRGNEQRIDRPCLVAPVLTRNGRANAFPKVKMKRSTIAGLLAGALLPIVVGATFAQTLPASPPLPPPRPVMPDDPPRAPVAKERETPAAPAPAPVNGDESHIAPNVDRAALRACAIEWSRMKAAGETGKLIWRDFAPGCVAKRSHTGG